MKLLKQTRTPTTYPNLVLWGPQNVLRPIHNYKISYSVLLSYILNNFYTPPKTPLVVDLHRKEDVFGCYVTSLTLVISVSLFFGRSFGVLHVNVYS